MRVPVFVQPESEQSCLLGLNALPTLGLTITGVPLIVRESSEPTIGHVRLVQSNTVPGMSSEGES